MKTEVSKKIRLNSYSYFHGEIWTDTKNSYIICDGWIKKYIGEYKEKSKCILIIKRNNKSKIRLIWNDEKSQIIYHKSFTSRRYDTFPDFGQFVKPLFGKDEKEIGVDVYMTDI